MIETVSFEKTTFAATPRKFEAGTPDIAGAVGLAAAIGYIEGLDRPLAETWEAELLAYTEKALDALEGVRILGRARRKAPVVSFVLDGIHAHDVGTALDRAGVAVRVGHHCAQPLMEIFGVAATVRASFSIFNTRHEVDRLIEGLQEAQEIFR